MRRDIPSQEKIKITFKGRTGATYGEENFNVNSTVMDLKRSIWALTNIPFERQYIAYNKDEKDESRIVLKEKHKRLVDYGILEPSTLVVKDIGPQISWRTVFLVEYIGPIIIFGLNVLIAKALGYELKCIQKIGLYLTLIHFIKREFESLFVHIFSNDTMPFKRIFVNSIHYWIFCGLAISTELFYFWKDPAYTETCLYILIGLWTVFEFCNLMAHITLRSLRTKRIEIQEENDSLLYPESARSQRGIPYGWGFGLVSCANYFWEICSWTAFAILVRCWTSYIFLGLSTYQMVVWALQKHKKYRKEFDGTKDKPKYPRGRKAIFPFIL